MANETNYQELVKKLLTLAEKGDAKSQYHLGVLYNDGKGVEKDYTQAASWYLKAAQQGHSKAQLYLGLLYQNGSGVQRDYKKAVLYFTKSAEQDEQKAQYYLGKLYYKKLGDLESARNWLEKSAEQGNQEAQKLLEELLLNMPDDDNGDLIALTDNGFTLPELIFEENNNNIPDLDFTDNDNDNAAIPKLDLDDDNDNSDNDHIFQTLGSEKQSSHLIIFVLLGVAATILLIGCIVGVLYLKNYKNPNQISKINTVPNVEVIKNDSEIDNYHQENFDVFKLAERGTLKQLTDAVKSGANFNVSRNIENYPEADSEEWLFYNGETPLHRAAYYNKNADSIKFLISQGLNVNAEASSGNSNFGTPLSCAVSNGNIDAVIELLKAGANPNSYSSDGNMFQIIALDNKNYSLSKNIVQALIRARGKIDEHFELDEKKDIVLPRNLWTSQNIFENILDNVSDTEVTLFIVSSPALTCAVLNDNPELVDLFLELKADPDIINVEGKTALDYAEELPENSRIKKSNVFSKLQNATTIRKKKPSNYDLVDNTSRGQLDKLIRANKVPDYVRDSGRFSFNKKYQGGFIDIRGTNVRLRSQPNTQARIISSGNEDMWLDGNIIEYLGEWTNPEGERWVLGDYQASNMTQPQTVWIYGKYTELVTEKDFEERVSIEAGEY